jgi:CheY-like chemotaxis protein
MGDQGDPHRQHVGHSRLLLGVRVLLVEDDPDAREILGALLEAYGATVVRAASCGEALFAFERFSPDVVVSDINLTGRSGVDLVDELRHRGARVPAIAVSSDEAPRDPSAQEFDTYFAKPVSSDALAEEIRRLVPRGVRH